MALEGVGERDYLAGAPLARGNQKMFAQAVVLVDSAGNELPSAASSVIGTSGDVANAQAAASLAAAAGKTNFITGFSITFTGATAAGVVLATVTGLLGGTLTFVVPVPAGATVGGVPILVDYATPHPASAPNTAITVTLPALGAGNLHACVNIRGIQK